MIDNKPALIQMVFKTAKPMELHAYKNISKTVSLNAKGVEEKEEAAWASLSARATSKPNKNSIPMYATEWPGSAIQDDDPWNINNFTDKHSILNVNPLADRIPGVQSVFKIVGKKDTWFCAHKEDSDLASINIHLQGEEKVWYIIPPEDGEKFEELFNQLALGEEFKLDCETALRHKCFIIPLWVLDQHQIRYTKYVQKPGEIMLTCYKAYHFGFNAGFNVCEAANIASPKFVNIFGKAKLCQSHCW